MDHAEKITVIETVACVAWANNILSEKETLEIQSLVRNIGDVTDHEIMDILASQKPLAQITPKLEHFSKVMGGQILEFCFRMSVTNNKMPASQLECIRQFAAVWWPPSQLDDVLAYLRKNFLREEMYFKLFLVSATPSFA